MLNFLEAEIFAAEILVAVFLARIGEYSIWINHLFDLCQYNYLAIKKVSRLAYSNKNGIRNIA